MTDLAERRGLDADVYQPAEDSRLLAVAAVDHVGGDDLVVDVGTGSGFVAEAVAAETGARVIGTDCNPHACREARERGVEAVRADLVAPIADGAVDVVTCNPPYLPDRPLLGTDEPDDPDDLDESDEPNDPDDPNDTGDEPDWMEIALSGGESGRAVVEALLADVGRVLRPDGRVLLLVSSLTGVDEVATLAAERGFSVAAVAEDSYPYETLSVLKLVR